MFKKILNSQSKTITSAAVILGAASLVSRLLGVFRDRILAGKFGAGDALDVYFAAFKVPDLIYGLLVVGALTAGFIPVFTAYLKTKSSNTPRTVLGGYSENRSRSGAAMSEEAQYLANDVLNIVGLGLVLVCGLAIIFAGRIVPLIVPGFGPEKLNLTISLSRLIFLSPIFLGISGVFSGVLQSFKHFIAFSLAPIFYNLGIIFGALFLTNSLGIYGLGLGVVLGAFLHMMIQIPSAVFLGFRYRPVLDFYHKGIRRIGRLMIPRTFSLGLSQFNFLAMTIIASTLTSGSLAVFNFAYNIYAFPLGIIAASYAVAAFPTMTRYVQEKDRKNFGRSFSFVFRQILFFVIPASALLIVLRAQIVRVLLGTGRFNWDNTILTIDALQFLVLGLFADALILLLIRGFFAIEDTTTPFVLGIFDTLIRVSTAYFLSRYWGVAGMAIGFASGCVVYAVLLWFFLGKKVGDLDYKKIFSSVTKTLIASLLAALAAYGVLRVFDDLVNMKTFLGIFAQGLVAGLFGIAIYVGVGLILRSEEMLGFWQAIVHRLPWSKVAPEEEIVT
ncbi:MAG: murein biosynthesis integral membrane protein MurJ [Candidatus Portnoybacteria bacterium]|nr:murein biosynthesis integral membrane protein MurJ [Candidatus Portnoybacteria bacterium]